MNSSDRYRRLRELFERARELPSNGRAGFLERECVDDAALLANVLHLLDQLKRAEQEGFLEPPVVPGSASQLGQPRIRSGHIDCPQCHSPIEVAPLHIDEGIVCPCCGSKFQLAEDSLPTNLIFSGTAPRMFGRFEMIAKLGAGAFGTVWKARDPKLDRVVALKIPHAGSFESASEKQRFLREARSVAQLQHPGIVPVLEIGQYGDETYLASDFISGVNLADCITARAPTFHQAAEWIAAIADAPTTPTERA